MKQKILRTMAILLMCGLLIGTFCACANAKNKKVIATSGEYEIPYEQLRFITMTYKIELDAKYGDGNDENGTIWDDAANAEKYRAELEELVWGTMRENYALLQACADHGVGRNAFEGKEIKAAVDEKIDELLGYIFWKSFSYLSVYIIKVERKIYCGNNGCNKENQNSGYRRGNSRHNVYKARKDV